MQLRVHFFGFRSLSPVYGPDRKYHRDGYCLYDIINLMTDQTAEGKLLSRESRCFADDNNDDPEAQ
jgi:hypothetical protein